MRLGERVVEWIERRGLGHDQVAARLNGPSRALYVCPRGKDRPWTAEDVRLIHEDARRPIRTLPVPPPPEDR